MTTSSRASDEDQAGATPGSRRPPRHGTPTYRAVLSGQRQAQCLPLRRALAAGPPAFQGLARPAAGLRRPAPTGRVFPSPGRHGAGRLGGERAIRRAHAKSRQQDRELPPLAPVDFSPGLTMKPAPGHCACSILRVRPIFTLASIGLSRR